MVWRVYGIYPSSDIRVSPICVFLSFQLFSYQVLSSLIKYSMLTKLANDASQQAALGHRFERIFLHTPEEINLVKDRVQTGKTQIVLKPHDWKYRIDTDIGYRRYTQSTYSPQSTPRQPLRRRPPHRTSTSIIDSTNFSNDENMCRVKGKQRNPLSQHRRNPKIHLTLSFQVIS